MLCYAQAYALKDPVDIAFYISATALAATPTANTIVLLTELAGGNRAAMSTALFAQYLATPVLLTIVLTVAIIVFTKLS
jgi:hypothetical protein